jgi:hypothetical protein
MFNELTPAIATYQWVRDRIKTEFPDIDEDTLADTTEGLTTLPELLAALVRAHLDDVDRAAALRARIDAMQQRLKRIEHRAEKKRQLVLTAMEQASLSKLVQPDFTVSLRPTPPALIIADENEIPAEYWRPQPAKLDRSGLLTALRSGAMISGAMLGNGSVTISLRTK